MQLKANGNLVSEDPSPAAIRQHLREMGKGGSVILSRTDSDFMDVEAAPIGMLGKCLAWLRRRTLPGMKFFLRCQEGPTGPLFMVDCKDLEKVIEIFELYLSNNSKWKAALPWFDLLAEERTVPPKYTPRELAQFQKEYERLSRRRILLMIPLFSLGLAAILATDSTGGQRAFLAGCILVNWIGIQIWKHKNLRCPACREPLELLDASCSSCGVKLVDNSPTSIKWE